MRSLSFNLQWAPTKSIEPAELTRGVLQICLGDEVLWGKDHDGFEWTWVDFLEHLSRVWPRLRWQPMPFGLEPEAASSFPALVAREIGRLDSGDAEEAEEEAFNFAEAHDLAQAVAGARLPSLWLVVEGRRVWAASERQASWLSLEDGLAPLERCCSAIAQRLSGSPHPRAQAAVQAWADRLSSLDEPTHLFTGWTPEEFEQLGKHARPRRGAFRPELVTALARAVRGVMPAPELKKVLDAISTPPGTARRRHSAPPAFAREVAGRPFEQGFALAERLRAALGLKDERVEPEALLRRWGVRVLRLSLPSSRQVDALATWGDRRRPVVVVNTMGRHTRSVAGQRASLAHELGHVLFDADDALPLGEALGGRMPLDVEQRARAFAAELLAPRALLASRYHGDALATVKQAAGRYGVSREIAAWQLRNAGIALSAVERQQLRGLVSRPGEF